MKLTDPSSLPFPYRNLTVAVRLPPPLPALPDDPSTGHLQPRRWHSKVCHGPLKVSGSLALAASDKPHQNWPIKPPPPL